MCWHSASRTPPVATYYELVEWLESLFGDPCVGARVLQRKEKVARQMGCFANLATCADGLVRSRGVTGDHVEHVLHMTTTEADQEEPVIKWLATTRPLKIEEHCHVSFSHEPVSPVTVGVNRDVENRVFWRARGNIHQTFDQRVGNAVDLTQAIEALDRRNQRRSIEEPAMIERFSQGSVRVRRRRSAMRLLEAMDALFYQEPSGCGVHVRHPHAGRRATHSPVAGEANIAVFQLVGPTREHAGRESNGKLGRKREFAIQPRVTIGVNGLRHDVCSHVHVMRVGERLSHGTRVSAENRGDDDAGGIGRYSGVGHRQERCAQFLGNARLKHA